ncbi:MAG: hypothetical protein LBG30_03880 [Odoribacteraceae bacterium]|jgi:hypothetical protein|nr:hypothetical protein [Odoribacteraceae bacterium]
MTTEENLPPRRADEQEALVPPRIVFGGKEALKRFPPERQDYLLVAAAEGSITQEELDLARELAGERFEASVAAYARVRLQPDPADRLPRKQQLYHRRATRWTWAAAAAVAIALVVALPERKQEARPLAAAIAPRDGQRIVIAPTPPRVEQVVKPRVQPRVQPRVERPDVPLLPLDAPVTATAEIFPAGPPSRLAYRAGPPSRVPSSIELIAQDNLLLSIYRAGRSLVGELEQQWLTTPATEKNEIPL